MKFNYSQAVEKLVDENGLHIEIPGGEVLAAPPMVQWPVGQIERFDELLTEIRGGDLAKREDLCRHVLGDTQVDGAQTAGVDVGVLHVMVMQWFGAMAMPPLAVTEAPSEKS